jgi:hypothetical protein
MSSQIPATASKNHTAIKPIWVLVKALLLFVVFNLLFALWNPPVGKLSAYNKFYPGLERFPYGQIPELGYQFSPTNLDILFASHMISGSPKPANEYRVLVIGDSSVWGYLLQPEDTLTGILNDANLTTCEGEAVRFYNLGFPGISALKDLFILIYAQEYDPDLVIWVVSLLSFPQEQQNIPVVNNNIPRVLQRVSMNDLPSDLLATPYKQPPLWERTIIGQRHDLMDIVSLHLYGIFWTATGVDQVFPSQYSRPKVDLKRSDGFFDWQPPTINSGEFLYRTLTVDSMG